MRIIRELNKEFPLYCYLIYIIYTWSVLLNIYSTLKSMHYLCIHYEIDILLTCSLMSSFWSTLAQSRPIISHHVIYHVTSVMCLFIINRKKKKKKVKRKEILNQEKRKRKMSLLNHIITLSLALSLL